MHTRRGCNKVNKVNKVFMVHERIKDAAECSKTPICCSQPTASGGRRMRSRFPATKFQEQPAARLEKAAGFVANAGSKYVIRRCPREHALPG